MLQRHLYTILKQIIIFLKKCSHYIKKTCLTMHMFQAHLEGIQLFTTWNPKLEGLQILKHIRNWKFFDKKKEWKRWKVSCVTLNYVKIYLFFKGFLSYFSFCLFLFLWRHTLHFPTLQNFATWRPKPMLYLRLAYKLGFPKPNRVKLGWETLITRLA